MEHDERGEHEEPDADADGERQGDHDGQAVGQVEAGRQAHHG